jgi:hypothetical protein
MVLHEMHATHYILQIIRARACDYDCSCPAHKRASLSQQKSQSSLAGRHMHSEFRLSFYPLLQG